MNALRNIKKSAGFSLIELMVVIAIAALLAAVAVPSYKTYVGKSRMAEVMGFITQAQGIWAEKESFGEVPTDLASPSDYITSIANNSNGFVVTMVQDDAIADEFNVAPVVVTYEADSTDLADGTVTWTCTLPASGQKAVLIAQYFTNCT